MALPGRKDVTDCICHCYMILSTSAQGTMKNLLDLKFVFIKGTPARVPYKVVNVWQW